jgi:putative ABC transport system permease protein
MLDKNIDVKKRMGMTLRGSQILTLHLTPFRDIHLAQYGTTERGQWARVYGFSAIAVLILLIACFNYMNLATARAMFRAREIALRKVVGAKRSQLIVQFLGESVATALAALALAIAVVEMLLPNFDGFLARPITYNVITDWPLSLAGLAAALAAGLLGGAYPALLLSRFRPADRLGTGMTGASGSGLLRGTLVVLQFAISIGLAIALLVMSAQLRYARQVDLGFDRHDLVVISGAENLTPATLDSMRQALAAEPGIAGAAVSGMVPLDPQRLDGPFQVQGRAEQFVLRIGVIDPDFLQVYRMKLLAGRNLTRDIALDIAPDHGNRAAAATRMQNILVSAAAARQFGFTPQQALGHTLISNGQPRMQIVGVVGDTNYDGLQTAIPPFVFVYDPSEVFAVNVRIKPGRNQAALAAMDRLWHRFAPAVAIQRHFQDDSFDRLFNDDERQSAIFAVFVGVAIFIACLGLFGLASFTAERRTREIGIRKVFGARTTDIVWLLLWQFSIPVLVANIIAWPVAWYYLRHWLQGYAFRISLSPLYFLAAGTIALVIAWGTVLVHTLITARASPIRALRAE